MRLNKQISRRGPWGGDRDGQYACIIVGGPATAVGPKADDGGRRALGASLSKSKGAACNQGTNLSQGKSHGRVICRAAIVCGAAFRAQRLPRFRPIGGAPDIRHPLTTRAAGNRPARGALQSVRAVCRDLKHQAASRLCETTASTIPGRWLTSSSFTASLMVSFR